MAECVIGVDVSKRWIDVSVGGGKARRIEMEAGALAGFAREAKAQDALVVFEATGGYDAPLCAALEAVEAAYARVNPAQARSFAQSCGIRGKTDAVDARMLAGMGARLDLVPTLPLPPARRALKALAARRRQLVEARKQELARLDTVGDAAIRASLLAHGDWLGAEIARIEAAMREAIREDRALAAAERLLRSAPGVGPVVAAALLSQQPELGQAGRRSQAALAGLAPLARDSGQRRGTRAISGGRPELRALLYLAALTAIRCDPEFAATHARLMAAGKAFKQSVIACAHKLLRRLNAMLKTGQPYAPQSTP
jgi:transposase